MPQVRLRAIFQSVSRYFAGAFGRDASTGWPSDFFTEVVGGWQADALRRPSQGHLETRDW